MTFDDEPTFHRSRESHIDIDMEEHEAPNNVEIPVPNAPRSDTQREQLDVPNDPVDLVDPVELVGSS